MWKAAKPALDVLRRQTVNIKGYGKIPLDWCIGPNWGDALNPVLVELLSGKKAMHLAGLHHDRYMVIGSILDGANERTQVWGSGFIRENGKVLAPPRAIHAVRGPLTRGLLLKQGIGCPEVYGDPALLYPRFFNPEIPKKYSVGIIPHYIDKQNPWLERYRNDPAVLVLDIESGINDFVCALKSCEVILSSSLHGLICADAYGIPNTWIRFSDDVVGGDFKFRDYRLSIGADEPSPILMSENVSLASVVDQADSNSMNIDLRKLLLSCPFLSENIRQEVLEHVMLPQKLFQASLEYRDESNHEKIDA
ncbi:polysaccharide pyruvyl transferase family protein [Mariprofundus erugo]|uniref:polysaccharide pyruvyl transferase family protein n=1 Tax=Mariprofundus erugo TaxID=2528639 RepID=UPI001386C15F|nr:polysaccharide pyruvyl transferase family protein [Mariprofundus erugo]